jgi:asparagine synthase (glutamine-hydrolysing)
MMHSLEVRVPFLDHRVVEQALRLPSGYKIDRGLRKRILVDAYRGHLPDAILDRPKQGFEVPFGEYLRGPLRDLFHDTVTREAVESFGILDHGGVERVHREHLDRRADHADLLFALLSLCWWRRRRS